MRWSWMLILTVGWLGFMIQPVEAEGSMDITVNVPLGGIVKYESWMRLDVTIANQEIPFSGFVELTKKQPGKNMYQSTLRQQVDITPGKSVAVSFDLPAQLLMDDWHIQLTQNGQMIQREKLRLPYPRDGRLVGVVHEEGNAYHFLAMNESLLNATTPFSVQNLTPQMLPDQSWIYQNLDVLALGGNEIGLLNERQVGAIKEWVKTGGIVILSAGPGDDAGVKKFADVLPLPAGRGGSAELREALYPYIGEKALPAGTVSVYNVDFPLFVSKTSGHGLFLFVNYDVTAEPLASWQHNLGLWHNVMSQHGAHGVLEQSKYTDQMIRPFLELSRSIPGVRTPSPLWMVVLWGGYVFVVAPLAYLVLKKWNRRQLAWGVIPGIAILFTVGTFAIGKPLVVKANTSYAITEVRILDEQLAQMRTASTFLTVDQNTYDVEVQTRIVALPLSLGKNDYEPEGMMDGKQMLSYKNVPYLTPRQAVGFGVLPHKGQFTANLRVVGDRLQGNVKNNTSFSLDSAFIEVGLQRIALGSMKKGEEKPVDARLEPLFMHRQPNQAQLETREGRVKQLQETVLSYGRENQIRVVGTNTEPLPLLNMLEPHQSHYWNVVSQTVQLQPDQQGVITYPYGLLDVSIQETTGDFDSSSAYLWELGKGSITFALGAGDADVDLKRLIVPLDHSSFRPFKIEMFHQKSGKWKLLGRGERLVLDKELQDTLTPQKKLLIRVSHDGKQRLSLPMPFFQVEGVERKW